MTEITAFDGTVTQGRKGVPYDWQSLVPEYRLSDEALTALASADEPAPAAA